MIRILIRVLPYKMQHMENPGIDPTAEFKNSYQIADLFQLDGETIVSINNDSMKWAKVTRLRLEGFDMYGIWERDLISDKWILNTIGELQEIAREWNEFTSEIQDPAWKIGHPCEDAYLL